MLKINDEIKLELLNNFTCYIKSDDIPMCDIGRVNKIIEILEQVEFSDLDIKAIEDEVDRLLFVFSDWNKTDFMNIFDNEIWWTIKEMIYENNESEDDL